MDAKQRLELALKQRDQLFVEVERIKARRDEAAKTLAEVEEECKEKGIPPDQIEQALSQIKKKLDDSITQIETQNEASRQKLQPFLQKDR